MPDIKERAGFVAKNFDEIAKVYDLFNDVITFGFHRLWKTKTAELAVQSTGPSAILDMCCGSGDIAIRLASLDKKTRIHALDFSEEMLMILSARMKKSGLTNIDPEKGDALHLPYKKHSFRSVTVGFGLRNIIDRKACYQEVLRVLAPGGSFIILDMGKPSFSLIRSIFHFYFRKIVPLIGFIIQGKKHVMYEYFPESARIYPGQEELKKELEIAGFHHVIYKNFFLGSTALHIARKP